MINIKKKKKSEDDMDELTLKMAVDLLWIDELDDEMSWRRGMHKNGRVTWNCRVIWTTWRPSVIDLSISRIIDCSKEDSEWTSIGIIWMSIQTNHINVYINESYLLPWKLQEATSRRWELSGARRSLGPCVWVSWWDEEMEQDSVVSIEVPQAVAWMTPWSSIQTR